MSLCFFASDLHGHEDQYTKLFERIEAEIPAGVFLGGDLLPHGMSALTGGHDDFISDFLAAHLQNIRNRMGDNYPDIFMILGNDDARIEEQTVIEAADRGIWHYAHLRKSAFRDCTVYGYAYVPPTPFMLKDWDRYDVSRHADPGCIHPTDGRRTVPFDEHDIRYGTIADDLKKLAGNDDVSRAIFLFHSPPYKTKLDRAALDGLMIDHAPLDVHVGSIAMQRFITARQPLLALSGHVHESTRLTGAWRDTIGRTVCMNAAHDGPELCLIRFDPDNLETAERELL